MKKGREWFSLSTLLGFHGIMIDEHKNRAHFMSAPCSKLLRFTRPLIIVLILLGFSGLSYGRGLLAVRMFLAPKSDAKGIKLSGGTGYARQARMPETAEGRHIVFHCSRWDVIENE